MKGPYERLKYDLRRTWECPQCHRKERTPGDVTFCHCECQTDDVAPDLLTHVAMKLIDEGHRRTRGL